MGILFWILVVTIFNGLIALSGAISFFIKEKLLNKIILGLVSFSAGTLFGGAFFHLFGESLENLSYFSSSLYLVFGFMIFFVIEKYLHWHHCHNKTCKTHPFSKMILIGDAIHNLIDGLIIASSFFVSLEFGFLTGFIIILHEIPQEMGNFGVLLYGGFSKLRALFWNFISQLTCVIGGLIGYLLYQSINNMVFFMLPFAAGGFIYISASDLIPELRKEVGFKKSVFSVLLFIFGLSIMLISKMIFS